MPIESPKYKVVSKEHEFEIRDYEGYIVAEVEIEEDYDRAINMGFKILADYIFGSNKKRTRIPMTSPVTETMANQSEKIEITAPVSALSSAEGKYKITFTMPSKYSVDTLPEPNSNQIRFRKVDAHQAAVIRFSGVLKKSLAKKKEEELKLWLTKNNLTPKSAFISAQYNPPWILGPFRKNEIIVAV
jgi:hypothetical protein